MQDPVKDKLMVMNKLLMELVPQELEARLELVVFVDPMGAMSALADTNNNNNNNNNNPPIEPIYV